MSFIDSHLRPGEKVLCRIQRSRDWRNLVKILVVDLLVFIAVFLLIRFLNYSMAHSYLHTTPLGGRGGFMAGSLLTGVVPILIFLAAAQDFAFTFFIELALTDQRILGRIAGPLWIRKLDLPHSQIDAVQRGPFGYLIIQRSGGRSEVFIYGFEQPETLAEAYRLFTASRRVDRRSEPLRFKHAG